MITNLFKKTSMGIFAVALLPVAAFLVAPTVEAAPPSAVSKAQAVTISVTVPEGSEASSFQSGGQTVTIEPGSTEELPVNATNLFLSKGSFLTVTYLDKKRVPLRYEVVKSVRLNEFSYDAFSAASGSFALSGGTPGKIQHRTKEIKRLLDEIRRMTRQNPNPTNIVGGDQTDGN